MISRLILSIREEATGSGSSHRSATVETTSLGTIAFFHSVTVIEEHDLPEAQQQVQQTRGDSIGMERVRKQ